MSAASARALLMRLLRGRRQLKLRTAAAPLDEAVQACAQRCAMLNSRGPASGERRSGCAHCPAAEQLKSTSGDTAARPGASQSLPDCAPGETPLQLTSRNGSKRGATRAFSVRFGSIQGRNAHQATIWQIVAERLLPSARTQCGDFWWRIPALRFNHDARPRCGGCDTNARRQRTMIGAPSA